MAVKQPGSGPPENPVDLAQKTDDFRLLPQKETGAAVILAAHTDGENALMVQPEHIFVGLVISGKKSF